MAQRLKLLILLLLLNFSGVVWATDYTADANCVAAYLFTEGSGTTVDDASANSNTGNFKASGIPDWDTNDVPFAVSGAAPNSVYFNPTNTGYIKATDNAVFDFSAGFSICTWAIPSNTDALGRICNRYDTTSTDGYFMGQGSTGSGIWEFYVFVGGTFDFVNSNNAPDGTWQHVCGLRKADGTLNLYVDGVLQTDTGSQSGAIDSNGDFYIGANYLGTGVFLNANLTDFGVFNDELTSTEINEIMDYGLKPATTASVLQPIINIF